MRKSRFTEEQIVTVIKEHESGTPTQELCRRVGIGPQTLYRWKAKYGGMQDRRLFLKRPPYSHRRYVAAPVRAGAKRAARAIGQQHHARGHLLG